MVTLAEVQRGSRGGTPQLVDVLPAESYRAGHIPGALSLPVGDLPARAADTLPDRDRDIVVYCAGPT